MYHIGGNTYSVVLDHKNGWNYEVFRDRYSEVLDRYDFIVGDWGYNQLRLKGFFKEANNKGGKDASISLLHDYLNEYCNFGCAYFIIEKLASRKNAEGREDGEDPDADGERLSETERPREYELKPRHQYQRKQQEIAEPRQREKQTAAVHALGDNVRKPANQEGGRRDNDREFRGGQKGPDNRRGQDGPRNPRDHGGGGKPRGEGEGSRQREFGGGKPRERENGSSRDADSGRQREQDGRRREQQNRPNRDQQSGERKQQGQHHQGEKSKHHPPRNKQGVGNGEQQRNRDKDRDKRNDRERDREKGRAEPLV